MPIWLRIFTYNKIKEHYKNKQEQIDLSNNMVTAETAHTVQKPNIDMNQYNVKAPKK